MTVYIDSLFLINFFMDSVILFITSIMRGFKIKPLRIFLSAFFSALYGTFMFFHDLKIIYSFLGRIAFSLFAVYIAFGRQRLWHSFFMFLFTSATAAGIFLLLTSFTDLGVILSSVISNCIVYLNINPFIMMSGCVALYTLMELYRRMCIKNFTCDKMLVDFDVMYMGKKYRLCGLIDTGCELCEPLSGSPVIVADKGVFGNIPDSVIKIYIDTAAGKSGLDMLLPERIVSCGEYEIEPKAVIALAENGFKDTRYNALINPAACRNINKGRRRTENECIKNTELV